MTDQTENQNAGIRWLSIFEMSMSTLVAAAVVGIFVVLMNVQSLQQSVDGLVERFNRAEQANNARFNKIEGEVQDLQLDVAKIKERLGSSDD